MKSGNRRNCLYFVLGAAALLSGSYLGGTAGQQPVYIYLYARATDHVNLEITEDRLRHILPAVEQYRKAHPEAHVSATVLFSGAVSQAIEQRNAQTHILDFVKDYIQRGTIEAGYDGTDEPSYDHRPTLKFTSDQSPADRWKMRQTVADQFLAGARDPLTGLPVSGDGGLKKMQEVFGPAAYIKGLEEAVETYRPPVKIRPPVNERGAPVPGASFAPVYGVFRESGGDTETLQMLRKYNTSAIMFGVPAANPGQLPGFGASSLHFGKIMGAAPDTAPEVYWQDYTLRISEAAPPVHAVKALEGVEALKGVLDKADRATAHVVEVELAGPDNYLQTAFAKTAPNAAMKYAYDHPQSPKLPADAKSPDREIAAGWAKEDALLKWLADDFFRKNPGSRFTSNADLKKMAGESTGFTISTSGLRAELSDALKNLGNDTHPFSYVRVDGHYLSLAELFQAMTDELAEYHRSGKLPDSVKVIKVYGPFRLVTGHGPNTGELTAGDIERTCAEIAGPLHGEMGDEVPKNSIPPLLKINDIQLNPAQLIRLMGLAMANPAPETKLPIRMLYMLSEAGVALPKTRPLFDIGFVWTVKPAPLAVSN
jgi:hypothetical protein